MSKELVPSPVPLLGMDLDALTKLVAEAGFQAYRAKQLHHWLYNRVATTFDEMHNIARDFRAWLSETQRIGHIELAEQLVSIDDSRKLLWRLHDGLAIEGVLMPERDWCTLCVSSQVGCVIDCKFCLTGFGGFRRNLHMSEILSQILLTKRHVYGGVMPRNIVFMGMGEPLLNLDQVIPAIRILTSQHSMAVAARRVTVSTSGIVPGLERLGQEDLGVNIAISLNAPTDELRDQIMPINRKYPIGHLIQTCHEFPLRERRRLTFEYVLIGGFNDSLLHARQLARVLQGLACKINLIPLNPDPKLPFKAPTDEAVMAFQRSMLDHNFTSSIRYSKGSDIAGACGQLAAHYTHGSDNTK